MIETGFPEETNVTGRTITVVATAANQWFKVAEVTMPNISENRHIIFYVHDGMFSSNSIEHWADGILNIMVRTGNPEVFTNYGAAKAEWLVAREGTRTDLFCLEVNETTRTVELWVNIVNLVYCFQFTVLAEGDRLNGNKHYFTLYDRPQPGTKPTEGYTEIKSTVAKLLAATE